LKLVDKFLPANFNLIFLIFIVLAFYCLLAAFWKARSCLHGLMLMRHPPSGMPLGITPSRQLHGKTSAEWQLHGKTSAADHAGSPTMQVVAVYKNKKNN